jgi:hypothetical protein
MPTTANSTTAYCLIQAARLMHGWEQAYDQKEKQQQKAS